VRVPVLLVSLLALAAGLSWAQSEPPARHEWEPAAPVLGPLPLERFAEVLPAWEQAVVAAQPARDVLSLLRTAGPTRIVVYFGSWCGDSFEHLPPLVAALRAADNPNLELELIGLDRRKNAPDSWAGIEAVPTVIVYRDGAELGRVVETPKSTMDRDVAVIVAQKP